MKQIGPYSVVRELGRGGMGVVYLATDTRLDRHVAIKALPEPLSSDADRLARFQREGKGAGVAESSELEFVEGETLEERLSLGALPIDEAIESVAAGRTHLLHYRSRGSSLRRRRASAR